jgi:hypothetical protein
VARDLVAQPSVRYASYRPAVAIHALPGDHLHLACDLPGCTFEGPTLHVAYTHRAAVATVVRAPRHPSRPVVGPLAPQLQIAQHVRIRDVDDPRVWEALEQPDPNKAAAQIHAVGIEAQTGRLAGATVMAILPVRPVDGGRGLLDGCHRACALYRLNPAAEADLIEVRFLDGPLFDPRRRAT